MGRGRWFAVVPLICASTLSAAPLEPNAELDEAPLHELFTEHGCESPSRDKRLVYVIASPERFNDGRVARLREVLGYTFIRADPVATTKESCDMSPHTGDGRVRGIFHAHQRVWSAIALSETLAASSENGRALVLESDFSVDGLDDSRLKQKMEEAFARQEDLTNVGWCDTCPDDDERAPCWSCTTGYIIGRKLARQLSSADFCMVFEPRI